MQPDTMEQFWIFGYGSLMWRPGFDFIRSEPAQLHGYHRRLCVFSFVHRGTQEEPGLVLGLDRGGSCHGVAFQIAPERWNETIAYLRAREQVTSVYVEKQKCVRLLSTGLTAHATTYVVDRTHVQYAGELDDDALLKHIELGRGISGHCVDYVLRTLLHLREMKIHDPILERLASKLSIQAASMSS
jgi:cation transport protein ChaC